MQCQKLICFKKLKSLKLFYIQFYIMYVYVSYVYSHYKETGVRGKPYPIKFEVNLRLDSIE